MDGGHDVRLFQRFFVLLWLRSFLQDFNGDWYPFGFLSQFREEHSLQKRAGRVMSMDREKSPSNFLPRTFFLLTWYTRPKAPEPSSLPLRI